MKRFGFATAASVVAMTVISSYPAHAAGHCQDGMYFYGWDNTPHSSIESHDCSPRTGYQDDKHVNRMPLHGNGGTEPKRGQTTNLANSGAGVLLNSAQRIQNTDRFNQQPGHPMQFAPHSTNGLDGGFVDRQMRPQR